MSEDDYYIDRGIDGHPICFGGIIQDKKTILQDLNALSGTTRSLYKENKDLQEQLEQKDNTIRIMVEKAAAKHRPAYDEQQRKILDLTLRNEKLERVVEAHNRIWGGSMYEVKDQRIKEA